MSSRYWTQSFIVKMNYLKFKRRSYYIYIYCLFSDQHRTETQPIKIVSSSNVNNKDVKPSASSFEDVQVDDSDENYTSPSDRKEHSMKSISDQNNKSNHVPKRHNFNEQMLLESMLDDSENDQRDSHLSIKNNNRLQQQNQSNIDSNRGFLLLDANEHLTVSLAMFS